MGLSDVYQMFIKLPSSEHYINLSNVNIIQVVDGKVPIVRIAWSSGQTWVFERENAIAICEALKKIQIVNQERTEQ